MPRCWSKTRLAQGWTDLGDASAPCVPLGDVPWPQKVFVPLLSEGGQGGQPRTCRGGSLRNVGPAHCSAGSSELSHEENRTGAMCLPEGCSGRHPTAQNLQEFLLLSLSARLLLQTASGQGCAHKARSARSHSPGTEALGAGTKGSLPVPCAGILAMNPENGSSACAGAVRG